MKDIIGRAKEMGAAAGRNAASWVFDGNTDEATYKRFLDLHEAGDPLIDEYAPRSGWLSGEDADAPTPQVLMDDLHVDMEGDEIDLDPLRDELCEVYETAADEAYWAELERAARVQTDPIMQFARPLIQRGLA